MMNNYIETWKKTIKAIIEAENLLKNLTENERILAIKDYARSQYKMIDDQRPNKELKMEEQLSIEQQEFIDYLKMVIETGNLDYEEN